MADTWIPGSASAVKWKDFPASKLTQRLRERTSGRYIQSDGNWVRDPNLPIPIPIGGSLRAITRDTTVPWVEIEVG